MFKFLLKIFFKFHKLLLHFVISAEMFESITRFLPLVGQLDSPKQNIILTKLGALCILVCNLEWRDWIFLYHCAFILYWFHISECAHTSLHFWFPSIRVPAMTIQYEPGPSNLHPYVFFNSFSQAIRDISSWLHSQRWPSTHHIIRLPPNS